MQNKVKHIVQEIADGPHDILLSEFVGESSPELDAAWIQLLRREFLAYEHLKTNRNEVKVLDHV